MCVLNLGNFIKKCRSFEKNKEIKIKKKLSIIDFA